MTDDGIRPGGTTRRGGLGTSLKVALAAPAALAAVPLGTAAADNDDHGRGIGRLVRELAHDRNEDRRDEAIEREIERLQERLAELRARGLDGQRMRLLKVSDVNTGGDLDKGNAASSQDSLSRGAVRVARASDGSTGRVQVSLVGAAANVTYAVAFIRFNDHGREGLGNVRTDGAGNFSGLARTNTDNTGDPVRLSGNNRVGAFILTRDGKDQFVTGYLTQ